MATFISHQISNRPAPGFQKRQLCGELRKGAVAIGALPVYFTPGIRGAIAAIKSAQSSGGVAFLCNGGSGIRATQLWPRIVPPLFVADGI